MGPSSLVANDGLVFEGPCIWIQKEEKTIYKVKQQNPSSLGLHWFVPCSHELAISSIPNTPCTSYCPIEWNYITKRLVQRIPTKNFIPCPFSQLLLEKYSWVPPKHGLPNDDWNRMTVLEYNNTTSNLISSCWSCCKSGSPTGFA